MGKKRTSETKARELRDVVVLGVEVATKFKAGIDEAAKREDRSRRKIVERALEAYLISTDVWPKPKDAR